MSDQPLPTAIHSDAALDSGPELTQSPQIPLPVHPVRHPAPHRHNPLRRLAWHLDNPHRVSMVVLLGLLCDGLLSMRIGWQKALLLSWIISTGTYLLLIALVAVDADAHATQRRTRRTPHAMTVLITIIVTALLSNICFGILLNSIHSAPHQHDHVMITLCAMAIFASWLLLHTSFGRYYCQIHYAKTDPTGKPAKGGVRGGFVFHHTPYPSQLDFFYLSFMVGLTYSSSDVNLTNRDVRKLVLLHSLVSFFYYSIIITSILNVAIFTN